MADQAHPTNPQQSGDTEDPGQSAEQSAPSDYPVRAVIVGDVRTGLQLVDALHAEGFTNREISVVCSEETQRQEFADSEALDPSVANANHLMNRLGAAGLGIGGAAAVTVMATTAGLPVIVFGVAGLALAGILTSVFGSRGLENEASDYYQQSMEYGKILVAVEPNPQWKGGVNRLERAESILQTAGAEVLPLSH